MMKKYMPAAGLLALSLLLMGCSGQDFVQSVNSMKETFVDNNSQNSEDVDNANNSASYDEKQQNNTSLGEKTDDSEEIQNETTTQTEITSQTEGMKSDESNLKYSGPEISILMVGDILLHTPVEESAVQEDGSYDFHSIFSRVKTDVAKADLAIVNQEVIIGGEDLGVSGYPSFNAPYEIGAALADTGFDVICHGTNHALDQGKKGITNCLSFWEKNYPDITVLGINASQESQDEIYVYEQDGIRIAVLNYTYGTNGIEIPSSMPYAVDMLEEEKVTSDLKKANELADFIVVCPHWGTEYNLGISDSQTYWSELFLENGVDLVIGTHPHVIEPIEWMENEKTGEKMLVYYSLGNFVNWTSGTGDGVANRMVGGMAKISVGIDESGAAFITDYGVEAVVCHLTEGTNGVATYPLLRYTEELAEENAIVSQDSEFTKEYCVNLCNEIWGELWE